MGITPQPFHQDELYYGVFPGGSLVKNLPANAGDARVLENPTDGGAWWAAVHGVAKSRTRLSDFPFTFHFHALEKEMATHSSVLARRIQGRGSLVGCRLWVTRQSPLPRSCSALYSVSHQQPTRIPIFQRVLKFGEFCPFDR